MTGREIIWPVYLGAGVMFCFVGCASAPKVTGVPEAELYTGQAVVAEQGLDRVVIELPFELDNPNGQSARLGVARWTLKAGEKVVGSGEETLDVEVPGGAKHSGTLTVTGALEVSPEVLRAQAAMAELPCRVAATLEVAVGERVEPYEANWYVGVLPPQPLTFKVESSAGRQDTDRVELNFRVFVANPNAFDVVVEGIHYELTIGGAAVADGQLAHRQRFRQASEMQFEISRFVTKTDQPELTTQLMTQAETPFSLKGVVTTLVRGADLQIGDTFDGAIVFEE